MDDIFAYITILFVTTCHGQNWILWPNTPPKSIPFEKSSDILDYEYLNNSIYTYGGAYNSADTWYSSSITRNDGLQVFFTPWTDGTIYFDDGSNITSKSYVQPLNQSNTTTGFATFIGHNVTDLKLIKNSSGIFTTYISTHVYSGRYPCSNIYYNNTWFSGTYGTINVGDGIGNVVCPFVGFRWSNDCGQTWIEPRMDLKKDYDNIFDEHKCSQVKFGAPNVIDFGENLKHSPDNKLYIIAHGTVFNNSVVSWIQGDQIYLAKVNPTIKGINDTKAWLFYNGENNWINNNGVADAKPLYTWKNKTGSVTMTYVDVLNKYIMTICTPTNPPSGNNKLDTYFLESDNITGPFKYITYLSVFGPQAYKASLPTSFLGKSIVYDNETGEAYYEAYLSYSANEYVNGYHPSINVSKPYGDGYNWSLQKSRFKLSKQFSKKLKEQK